MVKIKKDERVSYYSHFLGFLAAITGTIFLIVQVWHDKTRVIISLIYGLSVTFLFLSSSLYHAFKKREDEVSFWRKMDHFAIFIMIAGTYTPVCFYYLTGYWRWVIISVQWGLVAFGFFFKFFYLHAPRYLYTIIYLLMGWSGIIPIKLLFNNMPISSFVYLLAGGVAFTVGAVFYMIKRPRKQNLGFHEIFHIFILVGAFFHYMMVYNAIII